MLRSLWRRALLSTSSLTSRRDRPTIPLCLENLEDRCVPAGTVNIFFVQGPSGPSVTSTSPIPIATEGQPTSPSLMAAFGDSNAVAPSSLTVTINYGDGTAISTTANPAPNGSVFDSGLVVTQRGGSAGTSYTVTDSHTFPEESSSDVNAANGTAFPITLTVTENAIPANTDTNSTATAQVQDAPLVNGDFITVPVAGTKQFLGGDTGNSNSALQAFANFKAAVGGPDNSTATGQQTTGFRTINWDGVKTDGTDLKNTAPGAPGPNPNTTVIAAKTVGIPENRFQTRGVFFGAVAAVSSDGFLDVNSSVGAPNPVLFPANSSPNTFAPFNNNVIDVNFVVPSDLGSAIGSAASSGFGAIFLNVQQSGTTITYYHGSTVLDTLSVPTNATPSAAEFAGELFPTALVTNVRIVLGNGVIFKFDGKTVTAGAANTASANLVATDDFVYAEPQSIQDGIPIVPGGGLTAGTVPRLEPTEGQSLRFNYTIGVFHDTDPNAIRSDYTAVINWGDGQVSNGKISDQGPHTFFVSGDHTYATAGSYPINVAITDFGGATLTVQNTAVVSDSSLFVTVTSSTTPKNFFVSDTSFPVATFQGDGGPVSNYSATIDWGDGTAPSAGLITLDSGTVTVTGSHVLIPGKYNLTVTITEASGAVTTQTGVDTIGNVQQRFIADAFKQLLGRPVDQLGLDYWTIQFAKPQTNVQVLQGIEASLEYKTHVIQTFYTKFLRRSVDPKGLSDYLKSFQDGATDEQVAASILASPEYFHSIGGDTNSGFVTALYPNLLGRPADNNGVTYFTNLLKAAATPDPVTGLLPDPAIARGQVATIFMQSQEFLEHMIRLNYTTIINRPASAPPTASELNFWVSQLRSPGIKDEDVLNGFLTSSTHLGQI